MTCTDRTESLQRVDCFSVVAWFAPRLPLPLDKIVSAAAVHVFNSDPIVVDKDEAAFRRNE